MRPADLEKLVGAHMRDLPLPRAPHTLLPRVMAAVAVWTARPWYGRAWFTWPRAGQFAALAALALFTAGTLVLLQIAVRPLAAAAAENQGDLAALAGYVRIAFEVAGALWRTALEPLVSYAFAVVLLMCFACAVFGAALNHAVFGRMSEQ